MTNTPKFTTYAEAQAWVEDGQAAHGKMAFTATEEYAKAYPEIQMLHKAENPSPKRHKRRKVSIFGGDSLWSTH